ncbi:thiol reductant ABC exporter subunit CydD [Propionibacterium australiense]|uniref:Thiol reductant ABC exporter subunit CydD n=1 Tax=Propionibacterium australiense TaxID=119981 RepID=A0A8B3FP96_9ACTN|nr:thiol reductant ABC exporter subunit CydD [Propionibacterium australiense]
MPAPLDPRLIRRARATSRFLVAVALVGVTTAFLVLAQARLISDGIAHVVGTGNAAGTGRIAALLLAVFAARAGLNWLSQLFAHRACSAVKSQLRTDVMRARLRLPSDASAPSGTLITLLTQGLDALDGYYAKYLPQLMMAVSVPLVIGVAILTQDLRSAAMIAATIPLIPLFMALIGIATAKQVDRRFAQQTRLSNHFADLVAGLPTLQVFGRARAQLKGLRSTERAHRTETMRTLRLAFLSSFVLELLSTLSVALVAVSMGLRVVSAQFDLRTALFVLILTPEVYLPIRQVGVHFHDSADGTAAAAQAFEIIEKAEAGALGGAAPAPDPGRVPVLLDGLSVTYPGADGPALAPLSCRLEPGQVLALAGPSGGGKSTALNVLMGFQPATSGRVLVGDVDLARIDLDSWRARIAYVSQDPAMLGGTIADNVRVGFPAADDAQLRDALDRAGGEALCLDHRVADEGEGLSSGERRRVALARALLRIELGGARLLVLDEPTAGLDQDTEARAVAAVRSSGVSAIVISHRPALLEMADQVVTVTPPTAGPDTRPTGAPAGPVAPEGRHETAAGEDVFLLTTGGHPHALDRRPPEKEVLLDLDTAEHLVTTPGRLVSRLLTAVPAGRARLAGAVLLAVCATGSSVGLMGVAGWLLSRAAEHPPVLHLLAAAVLVRFFGIGRGAFRYAERLLGHDLALRMESALREVIFARLARTTLLGRRRGDLLVRVTADVEGVLDVVVRVLVPFLGTGLVLVATSAVMGFFSPAAAVLLFATGALAGFVLPWLGQRLSEQADRAAIPLRGELGDEVRQIARCAPELVAYGDAGAALARLRAIDGALAAAEARAAWTRGLAAAGQMLLCGVAVVGGLLIGGRAVMAGTLLPRELAVLVLTPLALNEGFNDLVKAAQSLTRARSALGRVLAIMAAEPVGRGDREIGVDNGVRELVLDRLLVGWPDGPVVAGPVDLRVAPGERVALTGPSGAGKTTLAATVMGLIPPRGGELQAPSGIGYLAQDAHVFATSIAENVRIGNKDATDEQVRAALDAAGLSAMSPEREVGEAGATLSGGETRRVAMARLLVSRERNRLVILDEPTEHLDHDTAEALMGDVWAGVGGAGVLVITHDPGLVEACDRQVGLRPAVRA